MKGAVKGASLSFWAMCMQWLAGQRAAASSAEDGGVPVAQVERMVAMFVEAQQAKNDNIDQLQARLALYEARGVELDETS